MITNFLENLSLLPHFVQISGVSIASVSIATVFVIMVCIGSFVNVVIYRLPMMLDNMWRREAFSILQHQQYTISDTSPHPPSKHDVFNVMIPASHCQHCKTPLLARDNIPIVSYLVLKGQCRSCHAKISALYPTIELLCGILGVLIFLHFGTSVQFLWGLVFATALLALAAIDAKTHLLPDIITLPLMWLGITLSFWHIFIPLTEAVSGAMIGYLVLWLVTVLFKLITGKEGMGLGDAKLLAALCAWLPITQLPIVLIIACSLGIIVSLLSSAFFDISPSNGTPSTEQRSIRNTPIAFGTFLAIAGFVCFLYGDAIEAWYLTLIYRV